MRYGPFLMIQELSLKGLLKRPLKEIVKRPLRASHSKSATSGKKLQWAHRVLPATNVYNNGYCKYYGFSSGWYTRRVSMRLATIRVTLVLDFMGYCKDNDEAYY